MRCRWWRTGCKSCCDLADRGESVLAAGAVAGVCKAAIGADVNVSAVARRHGISPSQLFGWRRKAMAKGQVKRRDAPDEDAEPASGVVEIGIGGATVRVGSAVSEDHLRRVLRAVRSA